jgi:hypothetical protein
MAKSKQSIVLTRREALLQSTTAGLGAALDDAGPMRTDADRCGTMRDIYETTPNEQKQRRKWGYFVRHLFILGWKQIMPPLHCVFVGVRFVPSPPLFLEHRGISPSLTVRHASE